MLPQLVERHEVWSMVSTFIAGGGLVRFGHYVATQMPPLPANAGWFTTFLYNMVRGLTGHDPNAK